MKEDKKKKQADAEQADAQNVQEAQAEGEAAQFCDASSADVPDTHVNPEAAELERKCNEYLDAAQRIKADFENYKKRNKSAVAEAFDEGANDTVKAFFPVLDNLERAQQAMSGYENDSVVKGVTLVYKQILEAFEKLGVSEVPTNCSFDPNLHNAVMQEECSEGVEENTITMVLQKGYMRGGRVLRFAMVKVAV